MLQLVQEPRAYSRLVSFEQEVQGAIEPSHGHKVLEQLMPLLWYGATDKAIDLLKEIEDKSIKSKADM